MIMVVWVALGGLVGLLVLADVIDYLLARAGKLDKQLTEDQLSRARQKLGTTATEARHSPFKYPTGGPPGV